MKLAEYEYEVIYKAGKTNVNADTLSRNPASKRTLPLSTSRESDDSLFHHPRSTGAQTQMTSEIQNEPDEDENDDNEQDMETHELEPREIGTEIIFSDEISDSDTD